MTEAATEDPSQAPEAPAEPAVALPWADVATEHHKMLRLLPLPTDRATGARPLRFVQFGYAERHDEARSLLRMGIELPGQRTRKEQNHLDVWLDHETRMVSFQPTSGLQMEPANRGLGRFMLAQAALWAQRKHGQYRLESGPLASKDGLNEDTRLRRDHTLRTQGLDIEYADAQHLKGRYKELAIGAMQPTWNTEKVQIVSILDSANMLQVAEQNLQEQEAKLRQHEERVNKYRRDDSGLRFTIACLVAFAVFQAGLLIWIATHR